MNKDEMIKEIEKEQPIAMMIQRYLDNNNIKVSNPLLPMHIEEMLNRKKYRQVADDEIVIKKTDYVELNKDFYDWKKEYDHNCLLRLEVFELEKQLEKAKQETRDILQELKNKLVKLHSFGDERVIIELLAEEHGIELEG